MDRYPYAGWTAAAPPSRRRRLGRGGRWALVGAAVAAGLVGVTSAQAFSAQVALPSGSQTLWGMARPVSAAVDPDAGSVELGQQFTPTVSGTVLGVKFWKTGTNAGKHVGNLWTKDGRRLASVTFSNETRDGWQVARFSAPVAVSAATTYVVSYLAPRGHYASTENFSGTDSAAQLTIPRTGSGVYSYGSTSSFPTQTWRSSEYWVDAVFLPGAAQATQDAPSRVPATTATTTPPPSSQPSAAASANPSPTVTPSTGPTALPTRQPSPSSTPKPTSTRPATTPTTASAAPAPPTGFPSATSTGVPAGVALSPYTGPATITTPGTVIDSKVITTPLVIAAGADNVTIRNSIVRTQGFFLVLNDQGATNLQIVDSELDGQKDVSNDAAVGGYNYTLTRVNVHGTGDGLKLGDNVTVQNSYIHDLATTADSHNDGMQSLGSDNVRITHNSIVIGKGSTSAIMLSTGSADSMRNILIDGNLLGGGAYTVYGGYLAGTDDLSKVSGIVISNNRFTTSVYANGGVYGPLTSDDPPAVSVQGNVWNDGPMAGQPVS